MNKNDHNQSDVNIALSELTFQQSILKMHKNFQRICSAPFPRLDGFDLSFMIFYSLKSVMYFHVHLMLLYAHHNSKIFGKKKAQSEN